MTIKEPTINNLNGNPGLLHEQSQGQGRGVQLPAMLATIAAMLCMQGGAQGARGLFQSSSPATVSWLRIGFGAAALLAATRGRSAAAAADWKRTMPYGLCLALMVMLGYEAVSQMALGSVSALQLSGPLLLAAIFRRRQHGLVSLTLSIIGVLAITQPWDGGANATGGALALGSGLAIAGYTWFGTRASAKHGAMEAAGAAMLWGTPIALLWAAATGHGHELANLSSEALIKAMLIGILGSAVPFALEAWAMGRLGIRRFALLTCAEPAVALLIGTVIGRDHLSSAAAAGILLIGAANVIATRGE